uniref:Uncharacterized protein n=1 Tax=Oryza punctata TaxID=4537 RepID=A0A0E0L9W7_ORYPU
MSSTRDSFAGEQSGLTPASVPTSVKRELGGDANANADGDGDRDARRMKAVSVVQGNLQPRKIALAELPTLLVNRRRLDRLLHELVRSHRWGDAAGVVSTLVSGTRHPESFEEMRSVFAVGMEIHRRLAGNSGIQHNTRSRYYLRTQKLYDVWMRRLMWLPSCERAVR